MEYKITSGEFNIEDKYGSVNIIVDDKPYTIRYNEDYDMELVYMTKGLMPKVLVDIENETVPDYFVDEYYMPTDYAITYLLKKYLIGIL